MNTNYADIVTNPSIVPQSQPIPGKESTMKKNHDGAFVFELDCWKRLNRFLILGADSATYYQTMKELVVENYKCVLECLRVDPLRTINEITAVSKGHRAPSNEPALFAMVLATANEKVEVRQLAYQRLSDIIRYGTDLLFVMNIAKKLRKSSMGFRKAIKRYYEAKTADQLAIDLLRFKNRNEWKQTDVIRMVRLNPEDEARKSVLNYVFKGEANFSTAEIPKIIQGEIAIKEAGDDLNLVCGVIEEFALPRELVPTQFHTKTEVWKSMLPNLKYDALTRNLNHLTRLNVITKDARNTDTQYVLEMLQNEELIKRTKIHPVKLLVAMLTYAKGRGVRGDTTWTPIPAVINALHNAFLSSFRYTDKLNLNIKLCIDVSPSTGSEVTKSGLTAREASMAMASWLIRQEDYVDVRFFGSHLYDPKILKSTSVFDMIAKANGAQWSGTNCALPVIDAISNKENVDLFVIFTDNETNAGHSGHASEYLKKYRKMFNRNSKMVVAGMTATDCSIADADDPGMLDVAGFDASMPQIVESFVKGWE